MKKLIIILAIIIIPLVIQKNINAETIEIPNEAIRIRVIANSNSIEDQYEKIKVRGNIQLYLQGLLKEAKSKEETEQIIEKNLMGIEKNIKGTLREIDSNTKYQISYGKNYFPEKEFKGVIYEEGYYDSLVITLGKGQGNNWWCVLFPPLCLMETEEENMTDVEYEFFVNEVISKYK